MELVIENNQNPDAPHIIVYGLQQNYPNPFNPTTEIRFALKESAKTYLSIYNIKGEKVKTILNGQYIKKDQIYKTLWDGTDDSNKKVTSGIYLYKMKSGKFTSAKKMILMK